MLNRAHSLSLAGRSPQRLSTENHPVTCCPREPPPPPPHAAPSVSSSLSPQSTSETHRGHVAASCSGESAQHRGGGQTHDVAPPSPPSSTLAHPPQRQRSRAPSYIHWVKIADATRLPPPPTRDQARTAGGPSTQRPHAHAPRPRERASTASTYHRSWQPRPRLSPTRNHRDQHRQRAGGGDGEGGDAGRGVVDEPRQNTPADYRARWAQERRLRS